MAGDIEAFLKMAAERRRQALEAEGKAAPQPPQQQPPTAYQPQQPYRPQPSRPAPPPPPANRPVNVPYSQPRPSAPTRQSSSYRPSTSTPVGGSRPKTYDEVELVEAEAIDDDSYFSSGRRQQLSHNLVSPGVSSDDIASHAEHLDDHWEKSLTDDEEEATNQKNFADELVKMFSNPDSITKAILVNEILKRPELD